MKTVNEGPVWRVGERKRSAEESRGSPVVAGADCTEKGRPEGAGAAGMPVSGGVFQAEGPASAEAPLSDEAVPFVFR